MKKTNYFSGMAVKPDDLLTSQSFLEKRIDTNMHVVGTNGVVVGAQTQSGVVLNPPYVWYDSGSLGIYGLIAYDSYGRCIIVDPVFNESTGQLLPTESNLTPDSDGKLIDGGAESFKVSSTYKLVIRYAEENDPESLRPVEGGKQKGTLLPTRKITKYELYLRDEDTDLLIGDVLLAYITTDSTGAISGVDETVRHTFALTTSLLRASMSSDVAAQALGNNITFEDHINMTGSGTVSRNNPHGTSAEDLGIDIAATGKHQLYLHSNGIKTPNIDSTTSALCPSYFSSTLSSEEKVYVEALTEDEIVVVNGKTLTSSVLGDRYVLSMQNYIAEDYEGFYIITVNSDTSAITLQGPFSSDTSDEFLSVLSDRVYLPICSFYWGRPYYAYYTLVVQDVVSGDQYTIPDVPSTRAYTNAESSAGEKIRVTNLNVLVKDPTTGTYTGSIITNLNPNTGEYDGSLTAQYWIISKTIKTADADRYDIDPISWKDRRVFNNIDFNDIRREDLAAIRDAAPFSNNDAVIYYARVESKNQLSYFPVGGLTLRMRIDGYPFQYTFIGVNELSVEQLLSQLNGELQSQIQSKIKPKAYINHNKHLTIVASQSLDVLGTGTANDVLGFSAMSDTGEDVKTLIYTGDMPSTQEMYYDDAGNLTEVYYITEGNYLRSHILDYSGDYISKVTEIVREF